MNHIRAPPGTRLEATEQRFYEEIYTILDNIGSPTAASISPSATTHSSADGEILVALNPLNHRPTTDYVRTLRYGCVSNSRTWSSISKRRTSSDKS